MEEKEANPLAVVSTTELTILLNFACSEHKIASKCDVCIPRVNRAARVFKHHTPSLVSIEAPILFRILFPYYPHQVLLTHVLYSYQCAYEYMNLVLGNHKMKEKIALLVKEREVMENRWMGEIDSDTMYCFAMESILYYRLAIANVLAKGQTTLSGREVNKEFERLNARVTTRFKETAPTDDAKSLFQEYTQLYELLKS